MELIFTVAEEVKLRRIGKSGKLSNVSDLELIELAKKLNILPSVKSEV